MNTDNNKGASNTFQFDESGMACIEMQLRNFRTACGFPVRDTPTVPPDDEVRLFARLLIEETCETLEGLFGGVSFYEVRALAEKKIAELQPAVNLVAVADGVCDVTYIAAGAGPTFGLPLARCWAEVHKSNMQKSLGPKDPKTGKQLKPLGWCPPNIVWAIYGCRY